MCRSGDPGVPGPQLPGKALLIGIGIARPDIEMPTDRGPITLVEAARPGG